MVYVIISTFYSCGGAEIQALNEFRYINKLQDNRAVLLTFDPSLKTDESKEKNHINLYGSYTNQERRLYDNFFSNKIAKLLKKILDEVKPDVIHMHNISFAYLTICRAIKGYHVIQTVHDYSVVCHTGCYIHPDGEVCNYSDWKHCRKMCFNDSFQSRVKFAYRNIVDGRIIKARKDSIDLLIAPSHKLTDVLIKFGYKNVVCINNAIDQSAFRGFKKNVYAEEKRIVLLIGRIGWRKGVYQLLNAYRSGDYNSIQLHIMGEIDPEEEAKIISLIKTSGSVYHGKMEHASVIDFLQKTFAVIIPSYGVENYPNVGLEGTLAQCVICGSDRGGIKEQVVDNSLTFKVTDPNDIKRCLRKLDEMSEEEYNDICKKQMDKFNVLNTQEVYFRKLQDVLSGTSITKKKE